MGYAHGVEWTDELVKKEIIKVKDSLNLKRMPTRKEMELVTKNSRLTNRISRTKGYYGFAKELNLPIKESVTTTGKTYEYKMKNKLEKQGFKVEKMPQNYPFDILINGNVKIDVKVAKPYNAVEGYQYHTFNLYRKYATCDIYICICLDEKEHIERMLIIPSAELKITQLSVGKNSYYNKFDNRFEYITQYSNFYNQIIANKEVSNGYI